MKRRVQTKREKLLKLARQARGTVDTVVTMIESEAYCPDIIQQADSVIGLLRSLEKELLAGHLDTCLMRRMRENKGDAIRELMKVYDLSH